MSSHNPCQHRLLVECSCCHITTCLHCGESWPPIGPPANADPGADARLEAFEKRLASLESSIEINADVWQRLADCETDDREP